MSFKNLEFMEMKITEPLKWVEQCKVVLSIKVHFGELLINTTGELVEESALYF